MRAANRFPRFVRLAPLLVLLGLTLFPFGWLGQLWPMFGDGLDQVFATNWRHAIGHATLFGLLGAAALATQPYLRAMPARYLGVLLLVGVAQELFQILYKGQVLWFDTGRDMLTDLAGILGALIVVWFWQKLQTQKIKNQ